MMTTREQFSRVFDLLVSIGGAQPRERDEFVMLHMDAKFPCDEYRFWGTLGFGGKYRRQTNRVDCYSEDMTPERRVTIDRLNKELERIAP